MRILITGSTGLLGRALCEQLKRLKDCSVREFRTATEPRDLRDPNAVMQAMDGIDAVFHLAGVLNHRRPTPEEISSVNVDGTKNVLDAAVRCGVRSLIVASSQAVYSASSGCPGPMSEEMEPRATDSYGNSKIATEAVCMAHEASQKCAVTLLRIATVYGPSSLDRDDVLSHYVHSARNQNAITVFGQGRRIRDLVWVGDVAEAMIGLNGRSGVYNIGGGYPYTSLQIAHLVAEFFNARIVFEPNGPDPVGLWMGVERVHRAIRYQPIGLREGLQRLLGRDTPEDGS